MGNYWLFKEFLQISTSCCSSGVEHFLGKEEVVSSILINSSTGFNNLNPNFVVAQWKSSSGLPEKAMSSILIIGTSL
jgi:hypothetical protein